MAAWRGHGHLKPTCDFGTLASALRPSNIYRVLGFFCLELNGNGVHDYGISGVDNFAMSGAKPLLFIEDYEKCQSLYTDL